MTPEIKHPPEHDPVRAPAHYTNSAIDWREVADDWQLSWRLTHALKYLRRHKHKGKQIEDLQKMIQYIEMEIDQLERARGKVPIDPIE